MYEGQTKASHFLSKVVRKDSHRISKMESGYKHNHWPRDPGMGFRKHVGSLFSHPTGDLEREKPIFARNRPWISKRNRNG